MRLQDLSVDRSGLPQSQNRLVVPHGRRGELRAQHWHIRWQVLLFLIGLIIPCMFWLGPLRLSVYRIALLITILPCLYMWVTGRAGRILMADIALLLFWLWGTLSLAIHHGLAAALQSGGITFIETMGAYLLARCYIRTADDFRSVVKFLFWIVIFLLPFGILEATTGRKPLIEFFQLVVDTVPINTDPPRMGLTRVQGPFEHPILFGVCCGSIFAMAYLVLGYQKTFFQRGIRALPVLFAAFLALSSGPLSAVAIQGMLLSWDRLLKGIQARWKILWASFGTIYVFLSLASNRSVYALAVGHAPLFDQQTAYYRLLIWKYGSASVLKHPLFGIGYNEYERESWMVSSIDMFWIIHSVMFGLPAGLMLFLAFGSLIYAVSLKKGLDQRTTEYRTAYLICMAGFFIAGWAVHFWNATYVWFVFLLGSGSWILEARSEGSVTTSARKQSRRSPGGESVYTRKKVVPIKRDL